MTERVGPRDLEGVELYSQEYYMRLTPQEQQIVEQHHLIRNLSNSLSIVYQQSREDRREVLVHENGTACQFAKKFFESIERSIMAKLYPEKWARIARERAEESARRRDEALGLTQEQLERLNRPRFANDDYSDLFDNAVATQSQREERTNATELPEVDIASQAAQPPVESSEDILQEINDD